MLNVLYALSLILTTNPVRKVFYQVLFADEEMENQRISVAWAEVTQLLNGKAGVNSSAVAVEKGARVNTCIIHTTPCGCHSKV